MEVRVQNGEPVVDLVDRDGNTHPCLYFRVAWACAEFGYQVKDSKQYAAAAKIISGIAEPGETMRPATVAADGETAAPETKGKGKKAKPEKGRDDEETESDDIAVVPVG